MALREVMALDQVTIMSGGFTLANPPMAMVATEEDMGFMLPVKESILPIKPVMMDAVYQVGMKAMAGSIDGSIPKVVTTPQVAMRVMEAEDITVRLVTLQVMKSMASRATAADMVVMRVTESDITAQLTMLQVMKSVVFRTTAADMVVTEEDTASTMEAIILATEIAKGTVYVTTPE